MRLTRWTHAHTGIAGLLAGFVVAAHSWWLAALIVALVLAAFLAGLLLGRFWARTAQAARAVRAGLLRREQRLEETHQARLQAIRERTREARARRREKLAAARAARRRLEQALELGRTQGAESVLLEQAARQGARRSRR